MRKHCPLLLARASPLPSPCAGALAALHTLLRLLPQFADVFNTARHPIALVCCFLAIGVVASGIVCGRSVVGMLVDDYALAMKMAELSEQKAMNAHRLQMASLEHTHLMASLRQKNAHELQLASLAQHPAAFPFCSTLTLALLDSDSDGTLCYAEAKAARVRIQRMLQVLPAEERCDRSTPPADSACFSRVSVGHVLTVATYREWLECELAPLTPSCRDALCG